MNNSYVLNVLGTKGYEILPRYKLWRKVRVFCGVWRVGGGRGWRMTKEPENLGKILIMRVIASPINLGNQ